MNLLFDRTYFRGLIAIPNVNSVESGLSDYDLKLWQENILIERLGTDTFAQLLDNISETSGIWHDLIHGKTYTDSNGDTVIYRGLVDDELKLSPLADYCYSQFVAQNYGKLSASGEMNVSASKNSTETPNSKAAQALSRCKSGFVQVDKYIRDMQDLSDDNFPDYEYQSPMNVSDNSLGL